MLHIATQLAKLKAILLIFQYCVFYWCSYELSDIVIHCKCIDTCIQKILFSHKYYHRTSIALMSVSEESTITLYKTLNTSFKCSTISPLDTGTFIVTTVDNPRPVRTIDVHGNEGEIQHKLLPDKSYGKYFVSACTNVQSTKTIVFTDRDQHTVYMCNITSGEGHVIKNDKIRSPTGVCAGPAGTVFVCCTDSGTAVSTGRGARDTLCQCEVPVGHQHL